MAQNDYFVIVYQVLKYLYDCLKRGEKPEVCYLRASRYSIPENYWQYILISLINEGYIAGIKPVETKGGVLLDDLQETIITPKGIEYLFENKLFEKVKRTLKDVKDIFYQLDMLLFSNNSRKEVL